MSIFPALGIALAGGLVIFFGLLGLARLRDRRTGRKP